MRTNKDISIKKTKQNQPAKNSFMPELLHLLLPHYCNNAVNKVTNIKNLKYRAFFSAIFWSFQQFQQCPF